MGSTLLHRDGHIDRHCVLSQIPRRETRYWLSPRRRRRPRRATHLSRSTPVMESAHFSAARIAARARENPRSVVRNAFPVRPRSYVELPSGQLAISASTTAWPFAMRHLATQYVARNHGALNLARALVNTCHANVSYVPLGCELPDEPVAAVNLQCTIANAPRRFGCE